MAVGAAFTAVSAALAPKPKPPQQQKRQEAPEPGARISLSSQNGASRFNATQGFQGQQQLAELELPEDTEVGIVPTCISLNEITANWCPVAEGQVLVPGDMAKM